MSIPPPLGSGGMPDTTLGVLDTYFVCSNPCNNPLVISQMNFFPN